MVKVVKDLAIVKHLTYTYYIPIVLLSVWLTKSLLVRNDFF